MAERWRQFSACKMLGCTPTELDAQPASVIDDFLAIETMLHDMQEDEMRRQQTQGPGPWQTV